MVVKHQNMWIMLSLLLLVLGNLGCIDNNTPIDILYKIEISTRNNGNYSILIPTVIKGGSSHNTPQIRNISPIVEITDYKIIDGNGEISYQRTNNATLLNITSYSNNLKITLEKSLESKKEDGNFPVLNSYYEEFSYLTIDNFNSYLGVIYWGKTRLNISLYYEMNADSEGNWLTMDCTSYANGIGFQKLDTRVKSLAA